MSLKAPQVVNDLGGSVRAPVESVGVRGRPRVSNGIRKGIRETGEGGTIRMLETDW